MRINSTPARWMFAVLTSCVLLTTACKKKPSTDGGSDSDGPAAAPEAVPTDMFLFANVRAQDLMKTSMFDKLTKTKLPIEGKELSWPEAEKMAEDMIGIRPSSLESASVFMPEFPDMGKDMPKMIAIVSCNSDINKDVLTGKMEAKKSARPGFYEVAKGPLVHFPDAKTLVILHPELASKYLDGFAKNRSGWPFTDALRKAASEHTLFVAANLSKLPAEIRREAPDEMRTLVSANSVTVAFDIKGTDLKLGVRGGFGNEGDAKKAKESIDQFLGMAKSQLKSLMDSPMARQEGGVMLQVLQHAMKTLDDAKIETSGSDLKVAVTFDADLPIGKALEEATGKVRDAATRTNSMNNLKQIGLAMHSCNDIIGYLPGGIRDKNGKLLLSWRVEILPFIEYDHLYKQFKLDEPWDSEHNKKLIPMMPKTYANNPNLLTKDGLTHYRMMFGKDVVFGNNDKMTIQGITDGSSNTILVFEATDPTVWTKPDEFQYDTKKPLPKFGSLTPAGFLALFGDGSVRLIPSGTKEQTIRYMFEKADGMSIDIP